MDRREELLGYIAKTKRLQKKLAIVFPALAAVSIALMFVSGAAGGFSLVIVALVAVSSFWITAAHNAAHHQKLDEMARVAANDGKPLQTAHRRWHH